MQTMLPSTSYSGRQLSGLQSSRRTEGRRAGFVVRAATAIPSQYKNVAPVGDRVFVKIDQEEDKTSSGILLPTSAQKKPTQGQVVTAGDSKAVKAGDKVVYSKYAGTEVSLDGQEHVILKEDDVIGLLSTTNIADLKPLGDRVLIQVEEAESQTRGGVLLTSASKDQPTLGKVVAVGSGKADDKGSVVKPSLSVGNTVLYSKYAGVEFEGENDTQYIVVKDSDILAAIA